MAKIVSPHCAAVNSFDCEHSGGGGGCGGGGAHVNQLKITNWNVEGLNDLKEEEIVDYMSRNSIDVCCVQETRKSKSDIYELRGFTFILSGCNSGSMEWYGVGFVVSPQFKRRIRGFCQVSERIATLKIGCSGGTFALITALAPHNLRPQGEKWDFFDKLGKVLSTTSTNGPKLLVGDFNARIGQARPGEQNVLGPYCFGIEAQHQVDVPNRDLLMEFCSSNLFNVANTYFDNPPDKMVTYHEPRVPPSAPICSNTFSVLDLFLLHSRFLHFIEDVYSDRAATLASHHFPVTARLSVNLLPLSVQRKPKQCIRDWSALQTAEVRRALSQKISSSMEATSIEDLDAYWYKACSTVESAVCHLVPLKHHLPNKPWISQTTLHLLDRRRAARESGNWTLEKQLRGEVKRSAKTDRAKWLEDLAGSGDWGCIKKLRKWRCVRQGRLHNADGEPVSSENRAETLAEHLHHVQWRVRPATLVPDSADALGPPLCVNLDDFTHRELRKAISCMSSGKATKDFDVPVEIFKALALEPDEALQWLLDLCNKCWHCNRIPDEWSTSSVAMLFKKGDPADPNNYRPICLLTIAYKLFASLVKQRLLDAGVEGRLWKSQFGFRKGFCTEDAIFTVLRKIEVACAQRQGQIRLLALDWKKAFDSIHVQSLLDALRRFGLPSKILHIISGLMTRREFYVTDCDVQSTRRPQMSGISQGCTLSPLLFIMLMTVLMHDAVTNLDVSTALAYARGDVADIVYADDTLLLASSDRHLQEFLSRVADAGRLYGMEFHWDKFQLLQVQCHASVFKPDGSQILAKPGMDYLGTIISHTGLPGHELGRRIGMAKADFQTLQKIWKHSSLGTNRKIAIYKALIESKLLYSLACLCLSAAERRRLDGFQNRCLRSILGILPAYVSRISNADVLQRSKCRPATEMVLQRQMLLFGKALRAASDHPLNQSAFMRGTTEPATNKYVRRVGRPRREWVPEIRSRCYQMIGGDQELTRLVQNSFVWQQTVKHLWSVHAPPGV